MENMQPGPEATNQGHAETNPSIDAKWYLKFKEIFERVEVYEALDGDRETREQEKKQFLRGEIDNPDLDYPALDVQDLELQDEALLALKNEIIQIEPNEVLSQTYRWRINERIAEIRMLRAAASGDMHRFTRYSEYVYGKPSKEIFEYGLAAANAKVKKAKESGSSEQIKNAEQLEKLLPVISEKSEIKKPSADLVEEAHQIVSDQFMEMGIELPAEGEIGANEISAAFELALQYVLAENWEVIQSDTSRAKINVNQATEEITVPKSRTVNVEKLQKLIMHEIRTHVERRVKGERSRLSLLGLGLDRYLPGEEGVATFNEQATVGKVAAYTGMELHLAAALALGLDGKKRDFREVFEILEKYFLLRDLPKYPEEDARKKSQDSAWNNTVRVFRGTDCKTRGACFTKDIVYREGNIAIWNLVSKNANAIYKFSIGKYDPTNTRHIWILSQLGILDSDLEELER